jgi:hypothetical protein
MKWYIPPPTLLLSGDRRIRIKFAWTPTSMHDGSTVWLEHYMIEEVWKKDRDEEMWGDSCHIIYMRDGWRTVRLFAQPMT